MDQISIGRFIAVEKKKKRLYTEATCRKTEYQ